MKTMPDASAFSLQDPSTHAHSQKGLSKREYIASLALQGILAAQESDYAVRPSVTVADAVYYADLLIAELNKASDE